MAEAWTKMSAADLGRGIGSGAIDAVALTEAFLEKIAADPLTPRIYARVTAERARAEAEAAQARAKAGLRRGPLDGVPVSWKDLFDSAGIATEAGSKLLEGRIPTADAPVLATGSRAGLVCLGKTHMSELAFSGLGLNPTMGTPPNINDPKAVPGGSSSGAGASVAFELAAAAIGSDTGGSVRIPSAWNDLVGLKTTHGRISTEGAVPLCEKFDTIGPLCRTVEDCALLLAAIEGGTAPDLRGASLKGAKLAVLETVGMEDLRPGPAKGFDEAIAALEAAGAVIERLRFPAMTEALKLAGVTFTGEAWGIWREVIEAAPEKMFARIYDRFRSGADVSAADFVAAWRRLEAIRREWRAAVAGYDAVVLPTSPILPPDAERLMVDDAYYVSENLLALRNTRVGNLMDGCGLTLPTSVPSAGIMFLDLPQGEERLLRLGVAAEAALTR